MTVIKAREIICLLFLNGHCIRPVQIGRWTAMFITVYYGGLIVAIYLYRQGFAKAPTTGLSEEEKKKILAEEEKELQRMKVPRACVFVHVRAQ